MSLFKTAVRLADFIDFRYTKLGEKRKYNKFSRNFLVIGRRRPIDRARAQNEIIIKGNSLINPSHSFRRLCSPCSPVTVSYIAKQWEQKFEWITPYAETFPEYWSINPRAYKGRGVGGGGLDATPIRFFANFLNNINYFHMSFSVAVHLSLRHILLKLGDIQLLW